LDPENGHSHFIKHKSYRRVVLPYGINLILAPIDRKSFLPYISPSQKYSYDQSITFCAIHFFIFQQNAIPFEISTNCPFPFQLRLCDIVQKNYRLPFPIFQVGPIIDTDYQYFGSHQLSSDMAIIFK
jgi:D-alanyl-lipoteichoic acid acyltransferase DltB (MBOAT superfamily)